jgi:hypothetical protein
VRFLSLLSLLALALTMSMVKLSGARAGGASHPDDPRATASRELAAIADHYRRLTWTYERAVHARRTASSLSYRRSLDRAYLQWTIDLWQRRAQRARSRALQAVGRRAHLALPEAPPARAPIVSRISYERAVTWRLQRVYPGRVTRGSNLFRTARSDAYRRWALHLWQRRAATAVVAVASHAPRRLASAALTGAFMCIHRYEGSWTSNTGNGYYGGLQMDRGFMRRYGRDFLARWGTADNWPAWAQIEAAARAHRSGRGFTPWPNTARACGLL